MVQIRTGLKGKLAEARAFSETMICKAEHGSWQTERPQGIAVLRTGNADLRNQLGDSMLTLDSEGHRKKACSPRCSRLSGRQIAVSERY
jgi:hypothetical protein